MCDMKDVWVMKKKHLFKDAMCRRYVVTTAINMAVTLLCAADLITSVWPGF